MMQKIEENFEELKPTFDQNKKQEAKLKKSKTYLTNAENQTCVRINQITIDKIKKKRIEEKSIQMSIGISSTSNKKNTENKEAKSKKETESSNKLKICISNNLPKYNISNYPQDVFKLINEIRNDPKSFIKDVEKSITLIKKVNDKFIYHGNLKIILNTGEKIFREAISFLEKISPMSSLVFNNDIGIELPNEEEYKNELNHFKKQILNKKKQLKIERYFRDAIKDPYIGVLMMVVDDTCKNQGEKRITILDPNLKNISIKCGNYGKFLAYFTFSK